MAVPMKKVRFNIFEKEDSSCRMPPITMLFDTDGQFHYHRFGRSSYYPPNDNNKSGAPKPRSSILLSKKRKEFQQADHIAAKRAKVQNLRRVLFLDPDGAAAESFSVHQHQHQHQHSKENQGARTMPFFFPPVPLPPKRSRLSSLNSNNGVFNYNYNYNKKRVSFVTDLESTSAPDVDDDTQKTPLAANDFSTSKNAATFDATTTPSPKKQRVDQSISPPPLARRRASRTLRGIISRMVS
jgi:hypothetical protein